MSIRISNSPTSLRAKRSNPAFVASGRKLDCFVASLLAMTRYYESAIPRRDSARVVKESFASKTEGAGNAGRWARPQPGRAEKTSHASKQSPRSHRNHPAFPAQWFTAYSVLSPVIGLSCHRHRRKQFRQLDAGVEASGPHGFTVRLKRRSSKAPSASTASRPASVTIASAPAGGETEWI
jgi:hypothetical protein